MGDDSPLALRLAWELDDENWDAEECWVAYAACPLITDDGLIDSTTLYLRVQLDSDRRWVWDISISAEDSGFGDPALDSGSATTIGQAKVACEAAARIIISEREKQVAAQLTKSGEDTQVHLPPSG